MDVIRGTTPTISYLFTKVLVSDITTAILTISHEKDVILTKTLADATQDRSHLHWKLTQEETLAFDKPTVEIMLNWKTADGTRGASRETTYRVRDNRILEVI